jgi:hypothetical protein
VSHYLQPETVHVQCVDDEPTFPARLFKQTWNGWACPAFDKETTDKIIEWSNTLNSTIRLEWDEDGNVIERDESYPDEEAGIYEPFIDENEHWYWPIGAWSWTWWKVED